MKLLESLEPRWLMSSYYVSSTGSDGADGSAAHPWQTLQHAADMARAGDVVTVISGHYSGFNSKTSGTATAPIVFKAQPGAVVDTRNSVTPDGINLEGASYVTIEGFTVNGISRAGIRSVTNDGVKILNNTITHSGMWGVLTGFSQNVDIESNTISGSVEQHGIYVSNSADNPTIRGNTVFNNGMCGIQINSDATEGGDGIITGALVDSNTIFGNGNKGGAAINLDGVERSIISNNVIYDNHSSGIALFRKDGAAGAKDNVVVNNTITMAADSRWAVLLKNGATENLIENNIILTKSDRHGGLAVSKDSLPGLKSDHNGLDNRLSADGGDSQLSIAQWRNLTGDDLNSMTVALANLFVDPSSNDFHLAGNALVNGVGTINHLPNRDHDGIARSTDSVTIGALETRRGTLSPAQLAAREPVRRQRLSRWVIGGAVVAAAVAAAGVVALQAVARQRGIDRWLVPYIKDRKRRRSPAKNEPVHVLLCIADHYEPQLGNPTRDVAIGRVERWVSEYPKRFARFADSDGLPPRHSFFYPLEQFDADEMHGIASLCRAGFGEVEVHLHHDHDTSENLRGRLTQYTRMLADQYQLLSTDRKTGELKYGFIHGNWALDNSRPDGRWCGVNDELTILRQTGCYCDFTLPSVPSVTQTRTINRIYYACDNPDKPKSHDTGMEIGTADQPRDSLLLIQGPLVLNWSRRKWGLIPRIENSCIQGNQWPTMARLDLWLKARVQASARPDWFFVKLHTHGAPEANQAVLLGKAMEQFHEGLAERSRRDANFHFHYVTAREMYNLARAAEAGWAGSVNDARDYELIWNGRASASQSANRSLRGVGTSER